MLGLELSAWVADFEKNREGSLALMREAAGIEVATPKHAVTPGPTLPAHEQLGDLLMKHKQPAEALVAYKQAIELYPRRFNGLLGAARAAREARNETEARHFYGELLQVSERGVRREALDEARSYVGLTLQ